jgi:4-amino-4-deoxy-L-arabinose transferase-like glycosyltransferase
MYDLGVPSFWLDEAISSIAAIAILDTGSPTLQSGVVYSRAILSTTLIALSFAIFGITEFAARLPSVFFGTLMIPLVYLIGSRWGNSRIAIIAAVLITFSVWEIAWSRQARMYQQLQFFYILSLYLFYEFTVHKNLKWGALLTLSVAGTVLSHVFGYVLLLVFVAYMLIRTLVERKGLDGVRNRTTILFILLCVVISGFAYHKGIISSVLSTEINYYDTYIYLLKKDL